jgi:citrate synthase
MDAPLPAPSKDYLSAQEAMRILDIRLQTLYAYVSRGWVRSLTQPGRKDRLYVRADIEKMKARSMARSGHGAVAASAMHWGEPIIPTSITEITPEGPRYRGRLATQLAASGASFEAVAELLWTGAWTDEAVRWPRFAPAERLRAFAASLAPPASNDQLMELFALFIMQLGISSGSAASVPVRGDTPEAAREIIQTMTACFGYISSRRAFHPMRKGQSIAEGLLDALALEASAENRAGLDAALVVLADHELSPSAFAARIAASSGAAMHSCIASAACTNSGVYIGRLYNQVEDFLARAGSRSILFRRAQQLQQRGLAVPGFGHPLYPQGDPRALLLLELAKRRAIRSKRLDAVFGLVAEAQDKLGLHPRQELALVILGTAMGLPKNSAGALFTLARTAGWVAHVREQRLSGSLLRPRAKFVGQF